ncbi:MAG: PP2C family serine/threonine-protein phosphatase [Thiohalobacterales bacterium]
MSWQFSMASDIGGRSEQQDSIDLVSSETGDSHLIIVADGMGGHEGGALASKLVVETARHHFNNGRDPEPETFLKDLCIDSHNAISALGSEGKRSPGSTCVLLYLNGTEASWAHVGDSRLYHFSNNRLEQQTCDHSLVQLMVERGDMSEDEAASSSLQNQLYMCLGGSNTPEPDIDAYTAAHNDLFILCSDGFWSCVEPEEVLACLKQQPFEEDCAARLVELARERGGDEGDNISLALIRYKSDRKHTPGSLFTRLVDYISSRKFRLLPG